MSVQNIVNITEANLQQTLEQSMTKPVLFYFWSERSQHCLQLTPVLESLAAQYNGQFILAKLDCDAEPMVRLSLACARFLPSICSRMGNLLMASRGHSLKKRSAPCWIKSCRARKS